MAKMALQHSIAHWASFQSGIENPINPHWNTIQGLSAALSSLCGQSFSIQQALKTL
jgi:hypothetical protein